MNPRRCNDEGYPQVGTVYGGSVIAVEPGFAKTLAVICGDDKDHGIQKSDLAKAFYKLSDLVVGVVD